jgi:molybdopterin-guanine dinucleotide biosynthesis protein A
MGEVALNVIILAGGSSRRFGSDKALFRLDGEAMLERALRRARRFGQQVFVLGGRHAERLRSLVGAAATVLVDDGAGPASALRAAFAIEPLRALVLAVDMPYLSSADLDAFVAAAAAGNAVLGEPGAVFPCILDAGFAATSAASMRGSLAQLTVRYIAPDLLAISAAALADINDPGALS